MEIIYSLDDISKQSAPVALSIGMFDGLHLGHQKIFEYMNSLSKSEGSNVVISFANHPAEFINPDSKIPRLVSIEEKKKLLKEFGIDVLINLDFDETIKNMSYDSFLSAIYKKMPFEHLILGKGSSFGAKRQGTEENVTSLGNQVGFKTHYLEKLIVDNIEVSSGEIRKLLQAGDITATMKLLGRPFTIYAPLHLGKLQETGDNLLKITYDFQNYAKIPPGHYVVLLSACGNSLTALAYLTNLSSDHNTNVVDLEIYIKGSKSKFLDDQIKIEFLRDIDSIHQFEDILSSQTKIEPFPVTNNTKKRPHA